jgi:hypothetical protein
MKSSLKIVVITLVMFCNAAVFGQIEIIVMTNDSSLVLEKVYVGGLGMTSFSVDSVYTSNYGNLRAGAIIRWDMTKWLTLNSYYMHQMETDQSWGLNQFSLKIAPCKKWSLQIGHMATLSTQQRPHPVSAGGQFETWAEAKIPGSALGAKTVFAPSKNLSFGAGVAVREQQPEYHANVRFQNLTLSGYYGLHDQKTGAALSYTGSRVWTTLVWKQDNVVANMFGAVISKKHNILMYTDMGYDLETKKFVRGEWGIYKTCTAKHVSVLPCLGYNYETRTIRGYLFIYL